MSVNHHHVGEKVARNFQVFFATCIHMCPHDGGRRWDTRFINHSCAENCRNFVEDKIARLLIVADEGVGEDKDIFIYYGQNYFQGMKCLCNQNGCFEKKMKLCIKDEKEAA